MLLPNGITFQSTPGHGYFYLSPERMKAAREKAPALFHKSDFYAGGNCFEEDLEWSRFVLAFPGEFNLTMVKHAVRAFRDAYPFYYSQHTGRAVKPEHSRQVRTVMHHYDNSGNYLAITAWGDWHELVPAGYVGVYAVKGLELLRDERGARGSKDGAYFLVPAEDYKRREFMEELMGTLEDICSYGINGGFGSFIYYSDTVKFFKDNRAAIIDLVNQYADDFGQGSIELVASFNCLNGNYNDREGKDEIGRAIYGTLEDGDTQIPNALAWFAAEEVARHLTDK